MKKLILTLFLCLIAFSAFASNPNFSAYDGAVISYKDMVSQGNTILFVWATWCPSCRVQLDKLSREASFMEDYKVFFINIGERKSTVARFIEGRDISETVRERIIFDQQASLADKFSIVTIPTYIFFKDGVAVRKSYFLDSQLLNDIYGKN